MTNQHDEHHDQTSLVHLLKGDSPICIECGRDMSTKMDEQTETDELLRILRAVKNYELHDIEHQRGCECYRLSEVEAKAAIEAWSRQQTAQILDELKRRHQMPLTHPYLTSNGSREILAVPVVYIDEKLAAIEALRVGLEGRK